MPMNANINIQTLPAEGASGPVGIEIAPQILSQITKEVRVNRAPTKFYIVFDKETKKIKSVWPAMYEIVLGKNEDMITLTVYPFTSKKQIEEAIKLAIQRKNMRG